MKTDGNIPVPIGSVFYFCPSVFVFVGSHFCIYGSRNEVSSSVTYVGADRVKNGRKYSRSDPFRFLFLSVRFRIYESRNEVSPSVSEESRFYMELTRIYSVFHPVFNLHKICLKIDMFKNISITKDAY